MRLFWNLVSFITIGLESVAKRLYNAAHELDKKVAERQQFISEPRSRESDE